MDLVLVGLGGFFGAIARRTLDLWVLGLLFAWAIERDVLPADIRGPLMIGFIGAYTTFSTLMLESWRLVEDGSWQLAAVNLAGSVALGMVAVVAGLAVGRMLP